MLEQCKTYFKFLFMCVCWVPYQTVYRNNGKSFWEDATHFSQVGLKLRSIEMHIPICLKNNLASFYHMHTFCMEKQWQFRPPVARILRKLIPPNPVPTILTSRKRIRMDVKSSQGPYEPQPASIPLQKRQKKKYKEARSPFVDMKYMHLRHSWTCYDLAQEWKADKTSHIQPFAKSPDLQILQRASLASRVGNYSMQYCSFCRGCTWYVKQCKEAKNTCQLLMIPFPGM